MTTAAPTMPPAAGAPVSDRASGRAAGRAQSADSYVGMVIALGSWAMLFAALFFSYLVVRLNTMVWPPAGEPPLPVGLAAINTLVLLASSLTAHRALVAVRDRRVRELGRWLVATLGLGALFLGLQLKMWVDLWHTGLTLSSGIYGSVFYALTTVHALHVVAGWIALGVVAVQAWRGVYRKGRHTAVRNVAMFWHFVDAVWVLMFVAVYVF